MFSSITFHGNCSPLKSHSIVTSILLRFLPFFPKNDVFPSVLDSPLCERIPDGYRVIADLAPPPNAVIVLASAMYASSCAVTRALAVLSLFPFPAHGAHRLASFITASSSASVPSPC